MVDIGDIPDFPGQPGQRPSPGAPSGVTPVAVVIVAAPLDRNYRNVALNAAAVDAFIAAEITAGRAHVASVERWDPWSNLQLAIPIELGVDFNYGRFTVDDRSWYAFLDGDYLNKTADGNTMRYLQPTPDVWTTYGPTIGYCMVERGHIAVAASQGDTYGDQYLTAPEPIDAPPVNGVLGAGILGSTPGDWTVLVISANDLRGTGAGTPFWATHVNALQISEAAGLASSATINHLGVVQTAIPNAEYPWINGTLGDGPNVMVPLVTPSPVSRIDGVSAGGGVYLFTPSGFAEYMTIMQGAPWITAGISEVRLVPSWAVGGGGDAGYSARTPSQDPADGSWTAASGIPNFAASVTTSTASGTVLAGWRETVLAEFGAEIFRKLITAPFTEILLSSGDGFASFRPDQWHASGIGYEGATGAAHGDPSIRLLPVGYNEMGSQLGLDTPVGGHAGRAASGYGLAAANTGSQDMTPYLGAFSSHTTWTANGLNKALAITLGLTNIQLNAGVQAIQTVLGGAASARGGVGGAADAALSALPTLATAGITASNTITMLDISQDGSFDIGGVLLGMSGVTGVAVFDAWYQTLSSVSGQGSPESLASGWRAIVAQGFKAVVSMPSAERIKALLSEWRRFGYMIGQAFIPPRLDVMTHWSFWQLSEPTILGAFPQSARDAVSAAFERGVTVWNTVAEIGTEPDNEPVAGVTY